MKDLMTHDWNLPVHLPTLFYLIWPKDQTDFLEQHIVESVYDFLRMFSSECTASSSPSTLFSLTVSNQLQQSQV